MLIMEYIYTLIINYSSYSIIIIYSHITFIKKNYFCFIPHNYFSSDIHKQRYIYIIVFLVDKFNISKFQLFL